LILASIAPDLDGASTLLGPSLYLRFHDALTHSLVATPLLALASVAIVWMATRRAPRAGPHIGWPAALAAALVGIVCHLGLDSATSQGVRLLYPFSAGIARLDWVAWFDIVIWGVFALAIAGPFLARLVGHEITSGSIRPKWPGRGSPIAALLFAGMYLWGRSVCHDRAVAQLSEWNFAGEPAVRLAALPDLLSPIRWRAVVETQDAFATATLNLARDFDSSRATIYHKPDPDAAIDAASQTPGLRAFLPFARFPLWRSIPAAEPENASLITVTDLASGAPGSGGLEGEALVTQSLKVLSVSIRLPGRLAPD
jgi:membrane-bound metal-dependent hydrolase YbcI (DUF457 family)